MSQVFAPRQPRQRQNDDAKAIAIPRVFSENSRAKKKTRGPSLHWLIREIHSYQTLHYLGIDLKHKTPYKD